MSKYRSTTHTTYNIGYHVVFCTKYRYRLLRYSAASRLKEILLCRSESLSISICAMEVMPEHVHLFVSAPPSLSIDSIVRELKGYSSRRLRSEYTYLCRYPSLWTRSYFVETIGHISEKTVVQYIEKQKSQIKHALSSPA